MNYRGLGRTGLDISELGYGAWGIGGTQWKGASDEESLRALRRAFDLGVNFIDTALAYGDGHSEVLAGRAVKEAGLRIYVATKIPPKNRSWPAPEEAALDDVFPARYVIESTEASLRNLGADTIDLQQTHVWNARWTPQEEWRKTFEDLKRSGKVRFIGVSLTEHDPASGLDLIRTGLIDAVQVIYNIFDPSAAEHLLPLARELGVGVLARVPLDEGGLTGAIREDSKFEGDEFRAYYFREDRKRQVVQHVEALKADLQGVPGTLAEIAIRFCLSQPAVTTVIPGMRRVSSVESNVRAATLGGLPESVLSTLARHRWQRNFYQ